MQYICIEFIKTMLQNIKILYDVNVAYVMLCANLHEIQDQMPLLLSILSQVHKNIIALFRKVALLYSVQGN